jgi:PAS domain S-box-containing protein
MSRERLFNKGVELAGPRPGQAAARPGARTDLIASAPLDPNAARNANGAARLLAKTLQSFQKATDREERLQCLAQMQDQAHSLITLLTSARLELLAALVKSIGKLLTTFVRDLSNVTPSTLRTVTHALDLITRALSNPEFKMAGDASFRVLVVDDHAVCRHALSMALNTPHLRLNVCENATSALALLKDSSFEVVFTDIMMPGIDGFGMVAQLRKLPGHARTPVVYVTALSDFETRAKSVLSGGCDIIAKPFSASEVVIKALTIGLKHRLDTEAQAAAAAPAQAPSEVSKPPVKKRPAAPMCPLKAVMCLEDTWRISTANRDTKVIFGYEIDEVLGQPLALLLPDDFQKENGAQTLEFLLNQSPLPHGAFQMAGRHKNETAIPVLVSFSETKTQRGRAYVCLIRRDQTMEAPPEETEAVEEAVAEPAPAKEPSPAPAAEPPPPRTQTEVLEDSLADMAERMGVLESQLAITQAALLEAQAELRATQQPQDNSAASEGGLRQELAELRSRMNVVHAQSETLNTRVLSAISAMEAARQDAANLLSNLSGGPVPPKSEN